ncbi:PCC domain-containing protein [Herbaspirillum rhizosphaerae]|uniref:PCC domain-containing protein n=1 Tax=Herbaspirillum rhizosphaerae TaxID=346179 RepID=UPI00067B0618|nr:DUF296 domain-containing protein [Herbaspirillum rhizosphaerae]
MQASSLQPAPLPFARSARHPGSPDPVRIVSLAGDAAAAGFTLQAGMNLRDAISTPLAAAGISGATVRFENLRVSPHHFLMPALSHDGKHAAFYSAPHEVAGGVVIELACATYGRRDGAPFVHCHAIWRDADGKRQGGHMLMDQTVVAEPAVAHAWGLRNATMETRFDPETNFTLFHPAVVDHDAAGKTGGPRTVLARIRPDQDLNMAIEEVCRTHGIRRARVRGSVGSIIGAEFEDGRVVEDLATEILVRNGEVRPTADGLRCHLDIALIDPRGNVCEGVLARGRNPVLICFELVLEEQPHD